MSCKAKAPKMFVGVWKKDSSTSGPTTRLSKPYESGTLVLKEDGHFNYKWNTDDIFGEAEGDFVIDDSTNSIRILKLMRDQKLYRDHIILEADNIRMKTSCKSSYDVADSTIYFDMVDVFKKIEAKAQRTPSTLPRL